MKRTLITFVIAASIVVTVGGCSTNRYAQGNPDATLTGAIIGGSVGNAIGGLIGESNRGWHGGYRGSAIGTIVGTIAGAAIGHATSAAQTQQPERVIVVEEHSVPQIDIKAMRQVKIRNIRFIDDGRNHIINPRENCKIVFDIVNEGKRTAYHVIPIVEEISGAKHIDISPSIMLEELEAHSGLKYTATLTAGKRLRSGEAAIRVAIADINGELYDTHEFTIKMKR